MDKYKLLTQKLEKREKVTGTLLTVITSPVIVEKMVRDDVDFILLDMEHGVFNNENAVNCLQVLRLKGMPSFVRVADTSYDLISRAIYMGADGIMLPRCETVEQVKTAVEAMNFAPNGRLGCGGHGQYRYDGEFFEFKRFLFLQIESPTGIKNLPQMISEYGKYISGIVIGPFDLSVTSGIPFQFESAELLKEIQEVFDLSKEKGVSAGIYCETLEKAKKFRKMGANILWACTDMYAFMTGYNNMFDGIKEID